MPGSAFIRHTVNNGTARSDDSEAEKAASSKSYSMINLNKKSKTIILAVIFLFLVQQACFVVRKRSRTEIGSKTMEIWGHPLQSPIENSRNEWRRERERERENFSTKHRVYNRRNKNPAATSPYTNTRTLILENSSSFSSCFSYSRLSHIGPNSLPHRNKGVTGVKCKSRGGRSDRWNATRTSTNLCDTKEISLC